MWKQLLKLPLELPLVYGRMYICALACYGHTGTRKHLRSLSPTVHDKQYMETESAHEKIRLCHCDSGWERMEQDVWDQEQAELREVAIQVMWQSCGQPYLLQPYIPDMPSNEYRWEHTRLTTS